MRFIGVLGLITILFIAFLVSNKRSKIRPRVILWGLSLQFLFAAIVLRQDFISFIGMAILTLLITVFVLQKDIATLGKGFLAYTSVIGFCFTFGALLFLVPKSFYFVMIASLAFVILNGIFKWKQGLQRYAAAMFLISGFVALLAGNIYGRLIFQTLGDKITVFLNLAVYGAKFLFGNLVEDKYFFTGPASTWPGFGFQFAFKVLPTIIFFAAFMSILYYLGVMQKVIEAMSKFMLWTIGTSGAETLSCTANIFVGQTEAPLLIKPFLEKMTVSELATIMVGGFGTIAGGVMAGYIAMGIPAQHLISASVMAAPACLLMGKMLYPETEHSATAGDAKLPKISVGTNVVDAASNGITDGLKLAVNVGAMLIGFIAMIALVDMVLNLLDLYIDGKLLHGEYRSYTAIGFSPAVGEYVGYFPGSLQTLFGAILKPFAWLLGIPWKYAATVGNLIGIKLSLNEFVAYGTLGTYIRDSILDEKSIVISTYILCGFANFSSIGIQIGGIGALAPSRRSELSRVGLKAMFGGAMVSCMTASIAGVLF